MPSKHYTKLLPPELLGILPVLIWKLDFDVSQLTEIFYQYHLNPYVLHVFLEQLKQGRSFNEAMLVELLEGNGIYPPQWIDEKLLEKFVAVNNIYSHLTKKLPKLTEISKGKKPYQVRAQTAAIFEAISHRLRLSELEQLPNVAIPQYNIDSPPEDFEQAIRRLFEKQGRVVPAYLLQNFSVFPTEMKTADLTHNVQAMLGQLLLLKFNVRFGAYLRDNELKQFAARHYQPHDEAFRVFVNTEADKLKYEENARVVDSVVHKIKMGTIEREDIFHPSFEMAVLTAFRDKKLTRDECVTYLKFSRAFKDDENKVTLVKRLPRDADVLDGLLSDKENNKNTAVIRKKFSGLHQQLPISQEIYLSRSDDTPIFSEGVLDAINIARCGLNNAVKAQPMLGQITREDIEFWARKGCRPKAISAGGTYETLYVHGEAVSQTKATTHDEIHAFITSHFDLRARLLFYRMIDLFRFLRNGAETPWSKSIWQLVDGVFAGKAINDLKMLESGVLRGFLTERFCFFLKTLEQLPDEDAGNKIFPVVFTTQDHPSSSGFLLAIDMVFNTAIYEQAGVEFLYLREHSERYAKLFDFVSNYASFIAADNTDVRVLKLAIFWQLKNRKEIAEANRLIDEAKNNPGFRSLFSHKRNNDRGLLSVCWNRFVLDDSLNVNTLLREIEKYMPKTEKIAEPVYIYVPYELTAASGDPLKIYQALAASGNAVSLPVYPNLDLLFEAGDAPNVYNEAQSFTRFVVFKVELSPEIIDQWEVGAESLRIDGGNLPPVARVCGYYETDSVMTVLNAPQSYVLGISSFVPNPEFVSSYLNTKQLETGTPFWTQEKEEKEEKKLVGPLGLEPRTNGL